MEGLIFEGAYVRREKCVLKSIGLALFLEGNLPFSSFYFVFEGNFQVQPPPGGAYISRGDLTDGFLRYEFGGLIFGGAYTRRGLFSVFYGIYLKLFLVLHHHFGGPKSGAYWLLFFIIIFFFFFCVL